MSEFDENSENTNNASSQQSSQGSCFELTGRSYNRKGERGTINVMTEEVVTVFDYCKVSYRQAVHIIGAVGKSFNINMNDVILNKTSFNRMRKIVRNQEAEKYKKLFGDLELNAAVIHWDGKLIFDSALCKQIDRVPIVLSSGDFEKILNVPALVDGKGVSQANAIHETLKDWGLCKTIKALCCDTTNSNLGNKSGAAVILEQFLERDLLYLPCRHHIMEVILACIFNLYFPGSSGPEVSLFKKFKNYWNQIDKTKYEKGLRNSSLNESFKQERNRLVEFLQEYLMKKHPRKDYKEFIELCLIFLGVVPSSGINFKSPGACHHARWMSKAIYSLKIYIFRTQFSLTPDEVKNLYKICLFVVLVYVEFWFKAPLAIDAPFNDLRLIEKLNNYRSIDSDAADAALRKFKNHLWYLSPEMSAVSLFNKNISLEMKRKIVKSFENDPGIDDIQNKFFLNSDDEMHRLHIRGIHQFIDKRSLRLLERFEIGSDFLKQDCSTWTNNFEYVKGLEIFSNLKVVNDLAERAVQLTEKYANTLTTDEAQKQYLFQMVQEFKRSHPDSNKKNWL